MEVIVPLPAGEFNFTTTNTSYHGSAPVSPQEDTDNSFFFSAPTSPDFSFFRQNSFSFITSSISQHSNYNHNNSNENVHDDNEAFAFSDQLAYNLNFTHLSSADEIFEGGKIKPIFKQFKPKQKKVFQNTLSFGRNNKVCSEYDQYKQSKKDDLSSSSSSILSWFNTKKWGLKSLLFHSASEGHETKFSTKNKTEDIQKNSSTTNLFKASKKKVLSAHEGHYKNNRAAAEEMRRKTYLPYKKNLMIGCIDLDGAGVHDPSRLAAVIL